MICTLTVVFTQVLEFCADMDPQQLVGTAGRRDSDWNDSEHDGISDGRGRAAGEREARMALVEELLPNVDPRVLQRYVASPPPTPPQPPSPPPCVDFIRAATMDKEVGGSIRFSRLTSFSGFIGCRIGCCGPSTRRSASSCPRAAPAPPPRPRRPAVAARSFHRRHELRRRFVPGQNRQVHQPTPCRTDNRRICTPPVRSDGACGNRRIYTP
jgi:hypothetical protein